MWDVGVPNIILSAPLWRCSQHIFIVLTTYILHHTVVARNPAPPDIYVNDGMNYLSTGASTVWHFSKLDIPIFHPFFKRKIHTSTFLQWCASQNLVYGLLHGWYLLCDQRFERPHIDYKDACQTYHQYLDLRGLKNGIYDWRTISNCEKRTMEKYGET